jgi:hypothetical protein
VCVVVARASVGSLAYRLERLSEPNGSRASFFFSLFRIKKGVVICVFGTVLFQTLISEEDLLFAKYLRSEKKEWRPKIADLNQLIGLRFCACAFSN